MAGEDYTKVFLIFRIDFLKGFSKMQHAYYSPSGADLWLNCEGGHFFNSTIKDDGKFEKYAKEGTALHDYAHAYLDAFKNSGEKDLLNFKLDNGIDFSKEKFLKPYFEFIAEKIKTVIDWKVEDKVIFCSDVWGTSDLILFYENEIEIVDLKTGFHEVQAKNNNQLMVYALAAMKTYELSPAKITMTIVQPKLNKISRCTKKTSIVLKFGKTVEKRIKVLNDLNKGKMELKTGSYCRFCRGNENCPLYKKFLL